MYVCTYERIFVCMRACVRVFVFLSLCVCVCVQSNLYITTTQGANKMWPLWTGGLYMEVPNIQRYPDIVHYKIAFLTVLTV